MTINTEIHGEASEQRSLKTDVFQCPWMTDQEAKEPSKFVVVVFFQVLLFI